MDSNYSGPSNWTIDEDDLFSGEDTESDSDQFYRLLQKVTGFRIAISIIAFFGSIGVIIFDIYLIVVICRNKKLKSLNVTKYVLNYVIFNLFMFLATPTYEIFLLIFRYWVNFSHQVYCIERQLQFVSEFGFFLLAFALAVDWLLKTYFDSKFQLRLLTIHDHSIKIIYLICFIDLVIDVALCFEGHYYVITPIASHITFFLLVILIAVCQFLNIFKNNASKKSNLPLTIATVMMLCWLPAFIYHLVGAWVFSSYTLRLIVIVTYFIPQYLAYGSTIVIALIFWKLNKYYKVAFTRSCCRSVRNYSGDDEHFEESEDEVSAKVNVSAKDATGL